MLWINCCEPHMKSKFMLTSLSGFSLINGSSSSSAVDVIPGANIPNTNSSNVQMYRVTNKPNSILSDLVLRANHQSSELRLTSAAFSQMNKSVKKTSRTLL